MPGFEIVVPLVDELMASLQQINAVVATCDFRHVEPAGKVLSDMFGPLRHESGVAIFDFSEMGAERGKVRVEWPMLFVLDLLDQVQHD